MKKKMIPPPSQLTNLDPKWCMVLYGIVWYCMVLYGIVWYCMVLYGIVWYCMVLYGIVWYGICTPGRRL
jgi:hypothetical protein